MSLRPAISIGCVLIALVACQTSRPAPTGPRRAPQRIVSRVVLADELLWQLGPAVRARVVSVSILADDPRHSAVAGRWPTTVARTTGSGEGLVALDPDLVIVGAFTNADVRSLLRGAGIETLVIDRLGGFEDFRANLRTIASAVHAEAEGNSLSKRFDAGLAELRRPAPAEPIPIVSWAEGIVAGRGTTFDDAAAWVGLRNLPAFHGLVGHKRISLEQMVAWDPAVIVVSCTPGECDQTSAATARRVGIAGTRAAKAHAVVAIEHNVLTSTGVGMLDLVAALREIAVHHGDGAK